MRAWPPQPSHPGKDVELLLSSDISHTRQTPTGCLQWALIREAEELLATWNLAPAAFKMGLGERVCGPDSWLMHHKHLRAPVGQDLHLPWPQSCIQHLCGALRADIKFFRDSEWELYIALTDRYSFSHCKHYKRKQTTSMFSPTSSVKISSWRSSHSKN